MLLWGLALEGLMQTNTSINTNTDLKGQITRVLQFGLEKASTLWVSANSNRKRIPFVSAVFRGPYSPSICASSHYYEQIQSSSAPVFLVNEPLVEKAEGYFSSYIPPNGTPFALTVSVQVQSTELKKYLRELDCYLKQSHSLDYGVSISLNNIKALLAALQDKLLRVSKQLAHNRKHFVQNCIRTGSDDKSPPLLRAFSASSIECMDDLLSDLALLNVNNPGAIPNNLRQTLVNLLINLCVYKRIMRIVTTLSEWECGGQEHYGEEVKKVREELMDRRGYDGVNQAELLLFELANEVRPTQEQLAVIERLE
ncbi:MAG: hypothetical protein ACHP6H_07615, partial [Legionellales bacterium]